MKIGFVGLGRMGSAIITRMQAAGLTPLAWNRSPRSVPAGVVTALSLRALAADSDVIMVMVRDDEAALDVHAQLAGLPLEGKIVAELGLNRLDTVHQLHALLASAGARFVDLPMVGTVAPAQAGQLLALAGGDDAVLDALDPILATFTRRVVRCGPIGSGTAMKLCINTLMGGYFGVLAEALGVGAAAGLQVEDMLAVIQDTPAALPALAPKAAVIQGATPPVAYSIDGVCKDLAVIAASAQRLEVPTPITKAALDTFRRAGQRYGDDKDLAIVARTYLPDTRKD